MDSSRGVYLVEKRPKVEPSSWRETEVKVKLRSCATPAYQVSPALMMERMWWAGDLEEPGCQKAYLN